MIVDTHCHLHFDEFDADREAVIARARDAGVQTLVNVGTDPVTNEAAWQLSQKYDFMFPTAGLHPHHAHEISEDFFKQFGQFLKERSVVAIGEIGLDYFKSQAPADRQKEVFVRMLHLAAENQLPVIIHSRNAFRDTLEILRAEAKGRIRGVMHCFSYDQEELKEILDLGFWASFTGILTYKNAKDLLEVAKSVPLDRLMIETDSPYLAPQDVRGKRNEPAYLKFLAEFLSEKRGIPFEELAQATTDNAHHFFGLNKNNE